MPFLPTEKRKNQNPKNKYQWGKNNRQEQWTRAIDKRNGRAQSFGEILHPQGHRQPGAVARINDHELRIAKTKGEFIWPRHDETDEPFIVHKGQFNMALRDRAILLRERDVFVVAKGTDHRPVAEAEREIVMLAPTGTSNTGNTPNERTAVAKDR